jgi:hypothetical protein
MRMPLTKATNTFSETMTEIRDQFAATMAKLGRAIMAMTVAMIVVTIVAVTALVSR